MKRSKKSVALLLVVALSGAALLPACGGKSGEATLSTRKKTGSGGGNPSGGYVDSALLAQQQAAQHQQQNSALSAEESSIPSDLRGNANSISQRAQSAEEFHQLMVQESGVTVAGSASQNGQSSQVVQSPAVSQELMQYIQASNQSIYTLIADRSTTTDGNYLLAHDFALANIKIAQIYQAKAMGTGHPLFKLVAARQKLLNAQARLAQHGTRFQMRSRTRAVNQAQTQAGKAQQDLTRYALVFRKLLPKLIPSLSKKDLAFNTMASIRLVWIGYGRYGINRRTHQNIAPTGRTAISKTKNTMRIIVGARKELNVVFNEYRRVGLREVMPAVSSEAIDLTQFQDQFDASEFDFSSDVINDVSEDTELDVSMEDVISDVSSDGQEMNDDSSDESDSSGDESEVSSSEYPSL